MPEYPPGFFLAVRADKGWPQHHHVVLVHHLQNLLIRSQVTGSQELAGGMRHHRHAHLLEEVDCLPVEDKGVGGGGGAFHVNLELHRALVGEFRGILAVRLPAALCQQDRILLTRLAQFDCHWYTCWDC